jgi:hypothetical protein
MTAAIFLGACADHVRRDAFALCLEQTAVKTVVPLRY